MGKFKKFKLENFEEIDDENIVLDDLVEDYEDEAENGYEVVDDGYKENGILPINIIFILKIASMSFVWIGLLLAIVLVIYLFIKDNAINACIFISGLIISFIFGYLFMSFLDRILINLDKN